MHGSPLPSPPLTPRPALSLSVGGCVVCDTCSPPDQAALDERRRQSIRKMEAGTVSKSIKEAMASAFQKFTTGVTPDGTTLRTRDNSAGILR